MRAMKTREDLFAADAARDAAVCGRRLSAPASARPDLAASGAHDPTPTPYFILDELLVPLELGPGDHLLDVGCGTGRVLAYASDRLRCRATGVELDEGLASVASSWASAHPQLRVVAGSALDIPLAPYSCFYLFNPFDTDVLTRFLDKVEREAVRPVALVHMSDNGGSFAYLGRTGWEAVREGSFRFLRAPGGAEIEVYAHPQHFTVWRFSPASD